jgi:hypothetical protein
MKWRSIQGVAVLFVSALLSGGLYGAVDIEKTFDVSPGGTLKVRAARSVIAVDVHPGSTVEASISAPNWSDEDFNRDFSVNFQQTGNEVTVELKARRHLSSWFSWGSREVRIDILVPGVFNLDLETSGGGISVADLSGDVRAQTSGGSIRIGRIDGAVSAQTSGGGIDLSGTSRDAQLSTSGGSISVGDVTVALAGELRLNLDASASGGTVRTDMPVSVLGTIGKSEVKGSINGGGPVVTLRTSGGSIRLERR